MFCSGIFEVSPNAVSSVSRKARLAIGKRFLLCVFGAIDRAGFCVSADTWNAVAGVCSVLVMAQEQHYAPYLMHCSLAVLDWPHPTSA